MKDKNVRKALFGNTGSQDFGDPLKVGRAVTIRYPKAGDNDRDRSITFRGDDGLILYLIKRIERLERHLAKSAMDEAMSDLAKILSSHSHESHPHVHVDPKGKK
jgi:hypothetical protein